jgi:hypothetical protein
MATPVTLVRKQAAEQKVAVEATRYPSFRVPLVRKEKGTIGVCWGFLRQMAGREQELNFVALGDAQAWLEHASALPGTTYDKVYESFECNGTLSVDEWWDLALNIQFCEDGNLGLASDKKMVDFFFPTQKEKQAFIEKHLTLQCRAEDAAEYLKSKKIEVL